MKQFFISLAATVTGLLIFCVLSVIIVIGIIGVIVGGVSESKITDVKENSVLTLLLDAPLAERSSNSPFKNFKLNDNTVDKGIGLNDVLANIKKAKTDDHIKGIYLNVSNPQMGMATLEEIRNALIDFKTSKKFILSYSEGYTQGAYYLASVADKVLLNPRGEMDWKGFSAQLMFFKGALDKLEIDAQIFRHGKFKSAIEPFDLDKMSAANREQTLTYINSLWDHVVEGISKQRKISVADLNKYADELTLSSAQKALDHKMVDGLAYNDQADDELRKLLGLKEKAKINLVSLNTYVDVPSSEKKKTEKEKIAIVYATGDIESGEGDDESIGSDRFAKAIAKAGEDSSIKAIVLRVNSPGGSALASDVIWREVIRAKKNKPVVVSMGDVAASGGYYISCAADAIIAQPNTITGSIGVFGLIPNFKRMMNNKLGITIDTANSNKHSDFGTAFRAMTNEEGQVIQSSIEDVYDVFISKVAEGRKMSKAQVDSIGQGRVWSGVDAKRIGLIDEFGGINDAIALAAKKAKLEKYRVVELPKQKDPIEELLNQLTGNVEASIMERAVGPEYAHIQHMRKMLNQKGVQVRLPYELIIR